MIYLLWLRDAADERPTLAVSVWAAVNIMSNMLTLAAALWKH